MKEHVTAHATANAVRMKRSLHLGAFVIVEGPSDSLLFQQLFDEEHCRIEVAFSKEAVLVAIAILNEAQFPGVLGVVDADYDRLLACERGGVALERENIAVTDGHDVICMMLRTIAFDRVIAEYGVRDRLDAYAARHGPVLATAIAAKLVPLGCLRLLSQRDDIGLTFKEIVFSRFIDAESLACDLHAMIKTVVDKSAMHHLDPAELHQAVVQIHSKGYDVWDIVCGHDLITLLSFAFRRTWCSRNATEVADHLLERNVRLAYRFDEFARTNLADQIRRWEAMNAPFCILCNHHA